MQHPHAMPTTLRLPTLKTALRPSECHCGKSSAAENPAIVEVVIARVAENPKTSLQQIHATVMCSIVYR